MDLQPRRMDLHEKKAARQCLGTYAFSQAQIISSFFSHRQKQKGLLGISHLVRLLRLVLVLVSLIQLCLRRSLRRLSALHVSSPPEQFVSLALSAHLRERGHVVVVERAAARWFRKRWGSK